MSTIERSVKYPPTAVRVNTSYKLTQASLMKKDRSMLSRTMNTRRVITRISTINGRTLDASQEEAG